MKPPEQDEAMNPDQQNEVVEPSTDPSASPAPEEIATQGESVASGDAEAADGVQPAGVEEAEDEGRGVALVDERPDDAVIARLITEKAALEARLRTVSAAYQKQTEDVAAARERLERQAALKEEMRRGEVVASLFEPLQNLRRSVEHVEKGASKEDTLSGLRIVAQQFTHAFEMLGLEEVPGKGARFDPTLHEALSVVPTADPALDGVVIEVFSAGYRIGSRLIQPARVVIAQMPEPEEPPAEAASAEE